MTENKSLLLYARLAARLEDFKSLRGRPSALFGIYTCVVLSLLFILCVLCAVKNKFTLPYLIKTSLGAQKQRPRLPNPMECH